MSSSFFTSKLFPLHMYPGNLNWRRGLVLSVNFIMPSEQSDPPEFRLAEALFPLEPNHRVATSTVSSPLSSTSARLEGPKSIFAFEKSHQL